MQSVPFASVPSPKLASRRRTAAAGVFALLCLSRLSANAEEPVSFNRDIRPILSQNCFYCHGQDPNHREAKLRLDLPEEATRERDGVVAVVPGKPGASEMIIRLLSQDRDEVMPPPKANKHVTPEQIALLKRWIAEGAKYEKHWAFTPPRRAALPAVKNPAWVRKEMDRFVLARLERERLAPSAEATPSAWLRRASFDLVGLAPTSLELDAFAADVAARGEIAYSVATDRLLASPRFGERLAQDWLDAARYADTHGFNNDSSRTMWRWRDWVIDAFNANQPYDRFLIEQFAGDLLPEPTIEQRIATGFGRNHVINSEGGIIDEEYRVEYVVDRIRTLGMSTLGLTLECARCHDHKFDPITQRDYYRLFAFFNQVPELGEDGRVANASPLISAPTKEQQERFRQMDAAIAEKTKALEKSIAAHREKYENTGILARFKEMANAPAMSAPGQPALLLGTRSAADGKLELVNLSAGDAKPLGTTALKVREDAELGPVLSFDGSAGATLNNHVVKLDKVWSLATWLQWSGGEAVLLSTQELQMPESSSSYGRGIAVRLTREGRVEVRLSARWPGYAAQVLSRESIQPGHWQHVAVACDGSGRAGGVRIFLDGAECSTEMLHDGTSSTGGGLSAGGAKLLLGEEAAPDPHRLRGELAGFRLYGQAPEPALLRPWVETTRARILAASEGTNAGADWLRELLLRRTDADYARLWEERDRLREERRLLSRDVPTTMVMQELLTPRETRLLKRGQYDAPGEVVEPGVPEALLGAWPRGAPRNRLGLALWLTQPDHPLTARVAVNRFWQQLFGTGIVKTSDDFGFQGEYPAHLELLDWLARDFVESGWNTKALLRTLVLSATYRQDSAISPALRENDPENRLLARGPRVRLPAEEIRDHALAVAGLLRHRLGGPSVYPTQPAGLYKGIVVEANYPGVSWTDSTGDDLYRRSIYTFWKRTVPYPVLNVFDAPDREFCSVRRSRTNTPLQALTMMNEPAMVEAGRRLGGRMLREGGADDAARLAFGFRAATCRPPRPEELAVLRETLEGFRKDFTADSKGARAFLKADPSDANSAAYGALGGLLLNLDETVTKN
jgi:hypothetical protein